ncbi:MAG: hypothetical protein ABI868_08085 [Acidobacteriota bacterium]
MRENGGAEAEAPALHHCEKKGSADLWRLSSFGAQGTTERTLRTTTLSMATPLWPGAVGGSDNASSVNLSKLKGESHDTDDEPCRLVAFCQGAAIDPTCREEDHGEHQRHFREAMARRSFPRQSGVFPSQSRGEPAALLAIGQMLARAWTRRKEAAKTATHSIVA